MSEHPEGTEGDHIDEGEMLAAQDDMVAYRDERTARFIWLVDEACRNGGWLPEDQRLEMLELGQAVKALQEFLPLETYPSSLMPPPPPTEPTDA